MNTLEHGNESDTKFIGNSTHVSVFLSLSKWLSDSLLMNFIMALSKYVFTANSEQRDTVGQLLDS